MRALQKLLLAAPVVLATGCIIIVDETGTHWGSYDDVEAIRGSGIGVTEERTVADFDRIDVGGSWEVTVEVGGEKRVEVEADDNLIGYVQTRVENGSLKVTTSKGNFSFRSGPELRVTVPSLSGITLAGSSEARVTGVQAEHFEAHVAGSADLTVSGRADDLTASVSGSGTLSLFGLEARNATVTVSGSGDANIVALESLNANVSGSGDVRYRGDPPRTNTSVSGSGTITRRN
jgi:hypothetical protein